jgi:hypothetical protein
VERACLLWSNGSITIEAVESSKANRKGIVFPKELNPITGKESTSTKLFNITNWRKKTLYYLASVKEDLKPQSMDEIMDLAYDSFLETHKSGGRSSVSSGKIAGSADDMGNNRVRLVDNSG